SRSDPSGRASLLSQAGLLAGAVLASACCWLPLVLIGAGASSLGAASFFAAWRPVFAGFTVVMLGLAFWFTYRRPRAGTGEACSLAGGEACCAAERAGRAHPGRRIHRILLWPVSFFALTFLLFPAAIPTLLGLPSAGNAPPAAEFPAQDAAGPVSALHRATIQIEGMDCEACAAGLAHALGEIPGVGGVTVDWKTGRAGLEVGDDPATLGRVLEVVRASGYRAKTLAEKP
ncbi:MAG: cation transporter, partial [Planctomycetota bacterium]